MASIHRLENAIAARLDRQVEVGHEFRIVAKSGDEILAHVARMAGGEAQALDASETGEPGEQPCQRPDLAVGSPTMIGVDVLAEQSDLAHARFGKRACLRFDLHNWTGNLSAARIRNHAEGAELVAPFL